TLRALPSMAPRSAACAAPSRNHHAAVSPCGWVTAGTSTRGVDVAFSSGGAVVAQAAASRVGTRTKQALRNRDIEWLGEIEGRRWIMPADCFTGGTSHHKSGAR